MMDLEVFIEVLFFTAPFYLIALCLELNRYIKEHEGEALRKDSD